MIAITRRIYQTKIENLQVERERGKYCGRKMDFNIMVNLCNL